MPRRCGPLLAALVLACGQGAGDPPREPPAAANLLANPGFEQGREGWHWIEDSPHWVDFRVTDTSVRSGLRALHLPVHWQPGDREQAVRVHGAVQELSPDVFPEWVEGWYRVERFDAGSEQTDLYVQFVAIVWGDPDAGRLVFPASPGAEAPNYQVRYYLAGIEEPPFTLVNAKFDFVGRGAPTLGEWTRFRIPLRDDFRRLWGRVPEGYDSIRLLFEARWDNKPPRSPVHAEVYFDDLYVGPAP